MNLIESHKSPIKNPQHSRMESAVLSSPINPNITGIMQKIKERRSKYSLKLGTSDEQIVDISHKEKSIPFKVKESYTTTINFERIFNRAKSPVNGQTPLQSNNSWRPNTSSTRGTMFSPSRNLRVLESIDFSLTITS